MIGSGMMKRVLWKERRSETKGAEVIIRVAKKTKRSGHAAKLKPSCFLKVS